MFEKQVQRIFKSLSDGLARLLMDIKSRQEEEKATASSGISWDLEIRRFDLTLSKFREELKAALAAYIQQRKANKEPHASKYIEKELKDIQSNLKGIIKRLPKKEYERVPENQKIMAQVLLKLKAKDIDSYFEVNYASSLKGSIE